MVFPSPESGFVPRRARTWPEVRSKFLQSDDLKTSIISWTRDFYLDLLFNYEGPFSCAPTPSERSTATRNQDAFRRKLFDRDGVVSLLGKVRDESSPRPPPGMTYFSTAPLQRAHIMPFSANSHPELRTALSIFAGQSLEVLLTGSQIDPSNGLLLDPATHSAFGRFKFCIECRDNVYRLRKLYADIDLPEMLARHHDREQLLFGCKFHLVPSPSELLCNLHLAIGFAVRESNAFQMISAILADEEEFNSRNTDGDYWQITGASYLERKLRGLIETKRKKETTRSCRPPHYSCVIRIQSHN
ncbi:hypothetical protein V1525DRAFT_338521 [Lipomyces kononenkoae]|uniref:Uncharacterized protein n=1 Tax=Lipomyces kononenkoae TaxID=34357 RepID=A0ACC3T879_LIPKO